MVMKHILGTLFLFFLFLPSPFSQYTSASESDPEALKLLKQAGESMSATNTQINFSLKVSLPGEEGTPSAGVLYQSGKSYHLQLDDYSIISDGKTRWVYLKRANEVNLYNETNGQDWVSPQDFLQFHTATDLVFVFAGTKPDGTSTIEAKPLKGRFEDYSKFTITVKNGNLSTIKSLAKDGTRQELKLGTMTHPSTLDAKKLFTFNAALYPGVHIEDLRLD